LVERPNPTFSPEHLRFLSYLRAVGTGPKGNRPLNYEEAKDAFELMVQRRVPDPLISAFLLGWRVQGERDEELQGCVDYLAETVAPDTRSNSSGPSVELGYPMDGKAKFPPIMLQTAPLLAGLDIHAAHDLPLGPKYGFTVDQFDVQAPNLHRHERREFLPGLSSLSDLRNAIGIRTAFNTLEKLNFLAPAAIIGMHHAPYFDLYASLYGKHYQRLIIVQGHEGSPDIVKKTKYKVVENGEVTTHFIDPEDFGIDAITAKEELDAVAMQRLWSEPDENLLRMIKLNAAFLGWAGGMFETAEDGYHTLTRT